MANVSDETLEQFIVSLTRLANALADRFTPPPPSAPKSPHPSRQYVRKLESFAQMHWNDDPGASIRVEECRAALMALFPGEGEEPFMDHETALDILDRHQLPRSVWR